jgi:hypothetical protein
MAEVGCFWALVVRFAGINAVDVQGHQAQDKKKRKTRELQERNI